MNLRHNLLVWHQAAFSGGETALYQREAGLGDALNFCFVLNNVSMIYLLGFISVVRFCSHQLPVSA